MYIAATQRWSYGRQPGNITREAGRDALSDIGRTRRRFRTPCRLSLGAEADPRRNTHGHSYRDLRGLHRGAFASCGPLSARPDPYRARSDPCSALARSGPCDLNGRLRALPLSNRARPERPRLASGLGHEPAPIVEVCAQVAPVQSGADWMTGTFPDPGRMMQRGWRCRAIRQ